jgi:hypothetical protein
MTPIVIRLTAEIPCEGGSVGLLGGTADPQAKPEVGGVRYGTCSSGRMPGRHRLSEVRSNSGAVPQW